ncbi:hypothetical protein [Halobacillus sp. BBL2006]|uniref:hypothetical protein n=1 Tax=Halobacillus sp. BBL2006 TaxID=1543706 RepID=UPI00068B3D17|nr:hypothetical protein [Halobacillus sp. BBL2006]
MADLNNVNGINDLTPNSLMPECIRVMKVYDWITDINSYENKTSIPAASFCNEPCASRVRAALEKHHDLKVECNTPEVPPPFPLKEIKNFSNKCPKKCEDKFDRFSCEILEIENGTPGVVRILWTVFVELKIIDATEDKLLCKFDVPVQFDEEYMICIPAPLDEDNISCRITKIFCKPTNRVLLGDLVQLRVTICKEIQVEAEVKLEVLGKFCQPRPNDIPLPPPITEVCPDFEFPPQCPDIFPRTNCDCQAEADIDVTDSGTRHQLEALICDNCTLSQSTWVYNYTSATGNTTVIPRTIASVECTGDLIMTVKGRADVIGGTGDQLNVPYTLTLTEAAQDTFALTAGTFTVVPVDVPNNQLLVKDCLTFNDIPYTTP